MQVEHNAEYVDTESLVLVRIDITGNGGTVQHRVDVADECQRQRTRGCMSRALMGRGMWSMFQQYRTDSGPSFLYVRVARHQLLVRTRWQGQTVESRIGYDPQQANDAFQVVLDIRSVINRAQSWCFLEWWNRVSD